MGRASKGDGPAVAAAGAVHPSRPAQGRGHLRMTVDDPPLIAGPVANPKRPDFLPPPGAWDTHAHVFGPAEKFPFAPGRGYTPPPAPVEKYLALLDCLGFAHGVVVQGNAHGYDNRV